MTKHTRRILFYSFIAIFVLFSIGVVFMAFGYGYDFVQDQIIKTGALGVKSNVSASIYINDKLAGQTSFLNNSFTENRLTPGAYDVRLEKQDHTTWQKKVNLNAGAYLDFPSIFLVPTHPRVEVVASHSLPVSNSQMLYGNWLFYINGKGILSYINTRSPNEPAKEFDGKAGPKITSKARIVDFDKDNNTALISFGTGSYLAQLDDDTFTILGKLPFKNLNNVSLRNGILYGLINNQLVAHDPSTTLNSVLLKKVRSFAMGNDSLVYIDTDLAALHLYSLTDKTESATVILPAETTQISQFVQHNSDGYIVLQTPGLSTLYRFNSGKLTKLSDYTNKILASPGYNKLLYSNDHEISVVFINATARQPYSNAGDQELLTRMYKPIYSYHWYKDEEHILVNADGEIIFMELDGRGGRNVSSLGMVDSFDYDSRSDTIYFFQKSNLYKMTLLQ